MEGGGRAVLPTPLFVTSILLELEEWLLYQTGGYLGRRIYFRGQIDNQESWEGGAVLPTPKIVFLFLVGSLCEMITTSSIQKCAGTLFLMSRAIHKVT